MVSRVRRVVLFGVLIALATTHASTQSSARIPTPRQELGANIGDDYFLATYSQLESYWKKLDIESERLSLVDIGRTAEGRTQWMAVISSPENMRRVERYRAISRRLARAEGLTDDQARALAAEGKAVVWIDGGLHADETLGAQQLIQLVYELVSRNDAETLRVLDEVIVLAVDANPDGHELVANWYMRERDPVRRSLAGLPRLYQKYVGHDNNRDFYMSTQAETININRVLDQEWFPQIVYDHHQTAPPGTVMFAPPFRGSFNYLLDPLVAAGVDRVGMEMQRRLSSEGKAGVTMRSGSTYSSWWNGGVRTTAYFHNQIGILTETIGSPTPVQIPYAPERQRPSADLPNPIPPQAWHFKQSIDYSMTANRAVLEAAARDRERLLLDVYRMGRNSIDRGNRDTWTASPHPRQTPGDPRTRDPRGYVLPSDQPDFPTATTFVNALIRAGVTVQRATATFSVNGRRYPAGSFVIKTAQAFRPHVLDMFEPQDYPDDIPYPGAVPTPPYDIAGWTLAYQMGVKFDRILDAFDGPFENITGEARPVVEATLPNDAAGYLLDHRANSAFTVVNRLLTQGADVRWLAEPAGRAAGDAGAFFVSPSSVAWPILGTAVRDLGVRITPIGSRPVSGGMQLRPVRIGLWDRYGGSPESGWIRWILERFEFPFELVYAQTLDAGNLAARFDVLIFPGGALPGVYPGGRYSDGAPPLDTIPEPYRNRVGVVSVTRTVPRLKEFVEDGGTLIAIGSSTAVATQFGLPVTDALVTQDSLGRSTPLRPERYYVPGSVLRVRVDTSHPLAHGLAGDVDVFFDRSPVFTLTADASRRGVRKVAWFATASPLRSGWAWGQSHLAGGVEIIDAPVGAGHVVLFGPEITFRGQSHGTFKFLFNAIYFAQGLAR